MTDLNAEEVAWQFHPGRDQWTGFTYPEMLAFTAAGISAQAAAKWVNPPEKPAVHPHEFVAMTPDEALAWVAVADALRRDGDLPRQGDSPFLMERGWTPPMHLSYLWHSTGFTPEAAQEWTQAGLDVAAAEIARARGLTPQEADREWQATGLTATQRTVWDRTTPDRAAAWHPHILERLPLSQYPDAVSARDYAALAQTVVAGKWIDSPLPLHDDVVRDWARETRHATAGPSPRSLLRSERRGGEPHAGSH